MEGISGLRDARQRRRAAVKGVNYLRRQEAKKPEPAPSKQELLLTEIRDLLKQR